MVKSIVDAMVSAVAMNEDGSVASVNFDVLDKAIADVRALRKELASKNKELLKAEKEAANVELGKIGKAYYDSLAVGAEFSYKKSDGTVLVATKIETKSNSGKRASCALVENIGKTSNRYPEFYQVIVPADWTMQISA